MAPVASLLSGCCRNLPANFVVRSTIKNNIPVIIGIIVLTAGSIGSAVYWRNVATYEIEENISPMNESADGIMRPLSEIPVEIRGIYKIEEVQIDNKIIYPNESQPMLDWMITERHIVSLQYPEMDHMYDFIHVEHGGISTIKMKSDDKGTGPNSYCVKYNKQFDGNVTILMNDKNSSIVMKMNRITNKYDSSSIMVLQEYLWVKAREG